MPHPRDARVAPDDRRQIVLVLQGGGALGAYQAGVFEALHESGLDPDWVVGTSIGAIQATIVAGNAAHDRVARLRGFWDAVSHKGLAALWPGLPGWPAGAGVWQAVTQGLPGLFEPNPAAWWHPLAPLPDGATGYYRTDALRRTLRELVDTQRLARGAAPRLTVGAVDLRRGTMRYFDSRAEPFGLEHVMASAALPPAFPPVRLGDDLYWDGGVYSNTPVEVVFDDHPRRDALIFAVQLWPPAGEAPRTMWQVAGRLKDIQYASRVDSHVRRQAQIHRLRHVVRELARELPAAARRRAGVREPLGYGCGTVMHLMRLVAPRLEGEDPTKDLDFQPARVRRRWLAGRDDARRMIARRPWDAAVDPVDGLVVHDLP